MRPDSKESSGRVVDLDGNVVGHHRGLASFTVGQRRGLGIASGSPLYVIRIDAEHNEVVVGSEKDLFRSTAILREMRWLTDRPPSNRQRVLAKARYRARAAAR